MSITPIITDQDGTVLIGVAAPEPKSRSFWFDITEAVILSNLVGFLIVYWICRCSG